jgi:hypothetical protein
MGQYEAQKVRIDADRLDDVFVKSNERCLFRTSSHCRTPSGCRAFTIAIEWFQSYEEEYVLSTGTSDVWSYILLEISLSASLPFRFHNPGGNRRIERLGRRSR